MILSPVVVTQYQYVADRRTDRKPIEVSRSALLCIENVPFYLEWGGWYEYGSR